MRIPTMDEETLHKYQNLILSIYDKSCIMHSEILQLGEIHIMPKSGRQKLECFVKALKAQTETIDSLYLLMYEWHEDMRQENERAEKTN